MKLGKKLLSVLTTFALMLSLATVLGTTVRADSDYSITIKANDNDPSGHTYEAYQVFAGTVSTDGELTNISYGTGVTGTTLLTKVKAIEVSSVKPFASCTDASSIASVLAANSTDKAVVEAFANAVSQSLTSTKVSKAADAGADCKVEVTSAGYYFIKDKDNSVATDSAYTKFILKVLGNESVEVKADVPSISKKIVEGASKVNVNTASIGDTINYEITSKVPDMTGYNKYFFVVEDTLSEGLTYDASSLTVKIGSTLSADKYVVSSNVGADGKTTLKISFKDFIEYAKGTDIVIAYSATLNDQAAIGSTGNPNTVQLTYTNNPNVTYNGKPSGTPGEPPTEPGDGEPTGKTPEQEVITFTTAIKIKKVDDSSTPVALVGAEFEIASNEVVNALVTAGKFEVDAAGTYYKLASGTYTTTAPTEATKDLYDAANISNKFKLVNDTATATDIKTNKVTSFVADDGTLLLKDVNAGTYTITETKAPDGYNLIPSFDIVVTATLDQNTKTCSWSFKKGDETAVEKNDGAFEVSVVNTKGDKLPSTGGMGTTILYVAGGTLVAVCAVLLITKKRMNSK